MPFANLPPIPLGLIFAEQFSPAIKQKASWDKLTPRYVLDYQLNQSYLFYLSATKGFKAGGFNSLGLDQPFKAEQIWNYELGLKSDLYNNKIRFNTAVFSWHSRDLQLLKLSGDLGTLPTYNIAFI